MWEWYGELHYTDPIEGVTAITVEETLGIEAKEPSVPREAAGVLKHLWLPQPVDCTIRSMPDLGVNGEAGPHTQGGPVELLQVQPTEAELVVHQGPPLKHTLKTL